MTRAFVFGDNIDTDQIIPARHMTSDDPDHLAEHCLSGVDPGFADQFDTGDIIVAGTNFGCGSSREHAPVAIQAAGADAVIAESFARIFFRNAINIGLPVLQIDDATTHISDEDVLSLDLEAGEVQNETTGQTLTAAGFPPFVQDLVDAGGLIEYGHELAADEPSSSNE